MYHSIKQSAFELFPNLTNKMRTVKHLVSDMSFRPHIKNQMYGGHRLRVIIEDRVAQQWYGRDIDLPQEFTLLAGRGLNPGALVFDLGAHQGVVAMMLAKQVGPNGRVVAIEASQRNAELAKRNADMNSMDNIEVRHAAVVHEDGPVLFTQRGNGSIALSEKEFRAASVDGVSIDTLTKTYGVPDLVYMDIEGFEVHALKGARETLGSAASWLIEVHGDDTIGQFGGRNRDVLAVFEEGYDLYSAIDNHTDAFVLRSKSDPVPTGRFFLAAIPRVQ